MPDELEWQPARIKEPPSFLGGSVTCRQSVADVLHRKLAETSAIFPFPGSDFKDFVLTLVRMQLYPSNRVANSNGCEPTGMTWETGCGGSRAGTFWLFVIMLSSGVVSAYRSIGGRGQPCCSPWFLS
jgi:hypothetical protein